MRGAKRIERSDSLIKIRGEPLWFAVVGIKVINMLTSAPVRIDFAD